MGLSPGLHAREPRGGGLMPLLSRWTQAWGPAVAATPGGLSAAFQENPSARGTRR